jgi:hypothetical protein
LPWMMPTMCSLKCPQGNNFWFLDYFLVNLSWIPLFPFIWVRIGVTAMQICCLYSCKSTCCRAVETWEALAELLKLESYTLPALSISFANSSTCRFNGTTFMILQNILFHFSKIVLDAFATIYWIFKMRVFVDWACHL